MRRSLPVVYSRSSGQLAILHGWEEGGRELIEINLDSDAWFAWLAAEQSFRFSYWQASGASVNFTVRPEKRGQRTYWQGWKTIGGQTLKKYIAPSATLTKAKLDAVGAWFYQQVEARTEAKVELKLYAAVVDLTWLVEQLVEHCQNPAITERVQQELKRIKHIVGN